MNKTELILNHIREKQGLKELSFGCKIKVNNRTGILIRVIKENKAPYFYEVRMDNDEYGVFSGGAKDLSEIEIIGHEVQLNHLLLAIKEKAEFKFYGESIEVLDLGILDYHDYDLTKTVQENLESNPELTNYLLTLFNL